MVGGVDFAATLPPEWQARAGVLGDAVRAVEGPWHPLDYTLAGALCQRGAPLSLLPALVGAVFGATGAPDTRAADRVAAGRTTRERVVATRDYDDAEWAAVTAQLAARGLLTADGELSAAGQELKDDIEYRTDAVSLPALDVLSDHEVETLFQVLTPIARQVIAGGDYPAITPMTSQHSDLDDPSANLG